MREDYFFARRVGSRGIPFTPPAAQGSSLIFGRGEQEGQDIF
ncbi:hypothetical protein PghCCS26_07910 [Paenibacillus glycanilyticus]|uniref:Uncharacterized protein n=1 Tax=Paenibacillus glycanilyticus TaxID=126569 RepID=A0ABQ6NI05_9BACL|nr:hypothetical protein PghCCS26_07910 [Paenibacillus glycanilyticus]